MTRRRRRIQRDRRSAAELELQATHRDVNPSNPPADRATEEAGWIRTWSDAISDLKFGGQRGKP